MKASLPIKPITPVPGEGPLLITGASGFIGANLCGFFHSRGFKVVAVERPSPALPNSTQGSGNRNSDSWRLIDLKEIQRIQVQLCDENHVREMVKNIQPAYVINCAAYGAYSSQTERQEIYQVNFDSVRFLLASLRSLPHFKGFIQAGTCSEYGFHCFAPKETDAPVPDSDYAVSKLAATALVQFYGKKFELPAWVLRLYSVYGPMEESSRLMPQLITSLKRGKWPPLVDPDISRDFISIYDVCNSFECLIHSIQHQPQLPKGEIFNIGSGKKTSLRELTDLMQEQFPISHPPTWGSMKNRHWDHTRWVSNPHKAGQELGWSPKISLTEGIVKFSDWMDKNPHKLNLASQFSILNFSIQKDSPC